jgi:flagellar motility protein MotE (MotC chaperone)
MTLLAVALFYKARGTQDSRCHPTCYEKNMSSVRLEGSQSSLFYNKITALVSYESQLEDSASSDESRIKTNFEGKLAAVTAEKSSVIEQLEDDLKKVRQELKSLSSSVDLKNKKIIEYETEIMKLKTSYGTAHASGSHFKPDKTEEYIIWKERK